MMLVEESFDTGEVVLNYAEGPDNGPPLLLIHGLTNRWQVWMPILPTLTLRWHVYAVDRRGYGKSGRVPGRYFPMDYISDLAALLDNLIKEPTVIYGHSAGGQLALALAAKHPHLVRAVIAGDPPLNKEYQLELMDRIAGTTTRRRAQAGRPFKELVSNLSGTMEPWELLNKAKTMSTIDPDVFAYLAEGRANEYFEGFNIDDILTMVTCPVLLLQGVIIRDVDVEQAISTMSDVMVVSIEDRGHMLGLTTWDVAPLLRAVMNFLESLR